MDLDDLESLLAEVGLGVTGAHAEVGITARGRFSEAYLRLTSLSDPESYAIISTSVSGAYGLQVDRGFHTNNADDQGLEYEEVRAYVESYVRAAIAYLDGHWSICKSRVFRVPVLWIETEAGRLDLASAGRGSTNGGLRF